MVRLLRHRQTKEAATDNIEPNVTAPHLDSTVLRPGRWSLWRRRFCGSGPSFRFVLTSAFDPKRSLSQSILKLPKAVASAARIDAGAQGQAMCPAPNKYSEHWTSHGIVDTSGANIEPRRRCHEQPEIHAGV
jgi:hypothetical protein